MNEKDWATLSAQAKTKLTEDRTKEDWDAIFFHAMDVVNLPASDRKARNQALEDRWKALNPPRPTYL